MRFLIALVLACAACPVLAHDARPVYIEVTDIDQDLVQVAWRLPPVLEPVELPSISMGDDCVAVAGSNEQSPGAMGRVMYRCQSASGERSLRLTFPQGNPSLATLVRYQPREFAARTITAPPGEYRISLPTLPGKEGVGLYYFRLGAMHILSGIDHLLFLGCIIWIAGNLRRIVLTVTGFTLAHSLTLALAALDVWRPPAAPTEALIALSIVFVAAELFRPGNETLTLRYPVLVSGCFGLLHGLGFASVLREVGLPDADALLALFAFNLGVEAGQLLFVSALVLMASIHRKVRLTYIFDESKMKHLTGFAAGCLAAFWFFERLSAGLVT